MQDLFGLSGKGALVVGAGQGIGAAVSRLLATVGARLALVDSVKDRIDGVARELRSTGAEATPLLADVTVESEVDATVDLAAEALGRIDLLVNIVGMASWVPLLEMETEVWDREHSLNLKQHFFVGRAVARKMAADGNGGAIAVVASVSGLTGAPNHGSYGAAKAGLVALTKTMTEEWEPYGIRVNALAPGSVLTPRILAMREAGELPTPTEDEADRWCRPEDVAGGLLFLVSDLARRVNGHTLVVDGGTTAMFPYDLS